MVVTITNICLVDIDSEGHLANCGWAFYYEPGQKLLLGDRGDNVQYQEQEYTVAIFSWTHIG